MRGSKKISIVLYAVRMTAIGIAMERNRQRLATLIDKGYRCSDERVLRVYNIYNRQHASWCDLEERYLEIKKQLIGGNIA